ncbi:MAG: hypothetical protein LBH91_06105 [Prevotellaceae bacterium]|jgi:heme/copper-type cytochrome/quinol oxidase subunit 2|nr:hypothetical protein [Prevotellaceae bacterium]
MYIKEIITFIIVVVSGGVAGYLFYLYYDRKKKKDEKDLNKRESMLTSIFTFVAIALSAFFISFTDNYFYMFLIFVGVTIGAGLILGLLLIILKKLRRDKNNSKEETM